VLAGIRTVLFDLDGTLTVPILNFDDIRRRLELPRNDSIIHALERLPPDEREQKQKLLRELELEAARAARPNDGAVELVQALQQRGLGVGIVTRNFAQAVAITLEAIGLAVPVAITRDCAPPKPSPEPIWLALKQLRAPVIGVLMVGDFRDDVQAGKAASVSTCLVTNGGEPRFEADLYVSSPSDLLTRFESAWK